MALVESLEDPGVGLIEVVVGCEGSLKCHGVYWRPVTESQVVSRPVGLRAALRRIKMFAQVLVPDIDVA